VTSRAHALFELKSVDAEQRVIEGIASTPTPDRGGDVMMPEGAQFTLPMPLRFEHKLPIGEVFAATVKSDGIHIKARVSTVDPDAPQHLKDRLEEAWHSIKANPPLARGLSIGWGPIESEPIKGTRFTRYVKWVWGETSVVNIPMNAEATILAVKNLDLAASGLQPPGVTGSLPVVRAVKGARAMTTQEQISSFENKRAANTARMTELMTKSEGQTLDEAQREEYTTLEREVDSIDEHLPRLRKLEKTLMMSATPVTPTTSSITASELRGGQTVPVITVKANVPKGTAFTRFAMAMASAKGDSYQAITRAKSWADSTPEVEKMVEATLNWQTKAAVAAGTTTDATWAGPLAPTQTAVNEFLELLRPRTLIGRVAGFRQVPFNTAVPSQTGGGTYSWVGQGNAKPVTSAAFATVTVPFAKAAGIIVLTEELVRLSTPSAEATVREEMIAGMGQFLDGQLVDPAVAAVANVNPASITNGAATAAASGATGAAARADLAARVATFTAANIPLDGAVWLMSDSTAFGLGLSLNALGQPLFPGVGREGGSIMGIPIVVSNNVGNRVILVHAPSILFADEGGVNIDVSREASIQMDSVPTNPSDATTVLVSLWQRNLVGLRAERMITWIRARTAAVTYISAAAYNGS
jgi:HK97 family phage major capsid protein